MLQLPFDEIERVGIQQLAQLGVAKQLAQLRLIHRQRLRAALGERGVAVVDVVRDVAEEQRRGEWRRRFGIDRRQAQRARREPAQHVHERRHVEVIAQDFAIGFEERGKRSEARRHGQQICGALALLPQRRPHPRSSSRQEQRARGGLAKPRRKQRGRTELSQHETFDLTRIGQQERRVRRVLHFRKPDDEAFVAPHHFDVDARAAANLGGGGHRPRCVDAASERGQQTDAPVAELVETPLDDDGAVVGDGTRSGLILEIPKQVVSRRRIEIVMRHQALGGCRGRHAAQLAYELADREAELHRTAGLIAVPERHLARLAWRGRDQHAVVRDLLDAPCRCAEGERLAHLGLEDHLFVQLADAGRTIGAGEEDAVQPAIGNRARVGDRDALRTGALRHAALQSIPRDARAQLGEFVGRIAAGEHVEHALEGAAAQVGERGGAPDQRKQIVHRPRVECGHRHDLLGEHVERVARIPRRFDAALVHGACDRRARDEIAAELRKDDPFADRASLMSGASNSLQPARDRWRRLDLDDEIDGAHVDAEFERGRRDQRLDPSSLEQIFDLAACGACERAMM